MFCYSGGSSDSRWSDSSIPVDCPSKFELLPRLTVFSSRDSYPRCPCSRVGTVDTTLLSVPLTQVRNSIKEQVMKTAQSRFFVVSSLLFVASVGFIQPTFANLIDITLTSP